MLKNEKHENEISGDEMHGNYFEIGDRVVVKRLFEETQIMISEIETCYIAGVSESGRNQKFPWWTIVEIEKL